MTAFINALLTSLFVRASDDEQGQGLVEYGLIIGLVAIALVTALGVLGGNIDAVFTNISGTLGGV